MPQVREILTRYQPDVLWWDTPVEMNPKRAAKLVPLLALTPGIITNDRLQRPDQPGDFGTPEQKIPDTGLDRDWETCMTMNKTWGYKSYDHNWKSAETLIRTETKVDLDLALREREGCGHKIRLNPGRFPYTNRAQFVHEGGRFDG